MLGWEEEAREMRKDIFLAARIGGMAHLASAYSCVEIMYTLYCGGVMRHDSQNPEWDMRDRFIMSKGHGSLALYSALYKSGYFSREQFMKFTRPDSMLGGEPSLCLPMGIEASTGSLGHGLSLGVGIALAQKADGLDTRTFVLLGDGECEEGSVWEAVMSAVKYKLDNLVAILDYNQLQKMDTVETVAGIKDWCGPFSSFGWDYTEVDGHNVEELKNAFSNLKNNEKPHVLIAHTIKGKGLTLMENNPAWHWRMPNRKELKVFVSELGISAEEME